MSTRVLVINSGSSSIKYQLLDVETHEALATGLVERIGQPTGKLKHTGPAGTTTLEQPVPDHEAGMAMVLQLFEEHGPRLVESELTAVGHRIVQGGSVFAGPAVIDDAVLQQIDDLSSLAPLHNPANVAGVRAARHAFPSTPHVAVFDTAFHSTLEPAAYEYAIDREVARRYAIRRYGAHGTSHLYVSRQAAAFLGKDPSEVNVIVLHLGNGASATAVRGGRSVETSMGLTPLEGLVMGTRSGDLDPAVLFHLARVAGMSIDELDDLLNRRSGMLGLSGHTDMRDVHAAVEAGDENARTALDVYYHRIKGYVGSYYAHLGRVDAIVFTAGIGENDDLVRAGALAGLERLGIEVDPERNAGRITEEKVISPDGAEVTVLVIPTNEELEIARQAVETISAG
ncbi:acetate/propionate family kinase [Cellulomonas cellasea]|uniref:Acetate kinase n=2 Tax=Cellulomonas cellasea TaxID=43670 RepID=A0A0A0B948_9CELL|nr:acetate kinase [Cellulomonas cellasea]KGM02324.1 acetate kinase [Cellulomonas cellasea DSM 20118]GEA86246.1 acetate kinase [Cellulomonas cellasea]